MLKFINVCTYLLFACLTLSLFACQDTQSGEAPADKTQSVSSGEAQNAGANLILGVMPSMDYLPLAVAEREGYFRDLGLTVDLRKFYSANERDAALQSGNIDGAVIDYTGALLQISGGLDLRLTSRCDAPFYIIASAQSGITSLAGLKGASIAVSRNTVIDYCVDMALHSAKLAPEDARKIEINKIPLRYEMLRDGQIDATGLPNPLALIARQDGGVQLASNADLGFSITGIVFTGRARAEKQDQLRKLYQAYNLGAAYLAGHSIADVADILKQEMGFTDQSLPLIKPGDLPVNNQSQPGDLPGNNQSQPGDLPVNNQSQPGDLPGNNQSQPGDLPVNNQSQPGDLPGYAPAALPSQADLELAAGWLIRKGLLPADFDCATVTDGRFVEAD